MEATGGQPGGFVIEGEHKNIYIAGDGFNDGYEVNSNANQIRFSHFTNWR